MAQVVDSSNLVEFVTTGKVPEFKPPEAPKSDAKSESAAGTEAKQTQGEQAAPEKSEKPAGEQARGDDGKFVKKDEAAKPAASDDDDDADLPERVRKQIGKKHRRMMEAEEFARERDTAAERERRRADAAERELERIRGGKSDGPKAGEDEGSDPDEPKQADFKTVGDYARAMIKYEAKKAGEAGRAQATQQRQQEHHDAIVGKFVERRDAFKAVTPDFDEVVEGAAIETGPHIAQYLVESEMGPHLGYHLAKNPDEITRLRKLSPSRQMAELGKLEVKLEAAKAPAPANGANGARPAASDVSRAPAPISPLEGKSTPVTKDPSQMSVSELREYRRQEARAKSAR